MKFVTYRRVSTKKQGESGLGLEAQDRDIAFFLAGYAADAEVIAQFIEVDSGANDSREVLIEAIDLCRQTGATLLVAKLDRLSRDVAFIATLMKDPKVNFRVAVMPHASKFELHIYAALAEQEREMISQRTKMALAELKAAGKALGGLRAKTAARNAETRQLAYAQAVDLQDAFEAMKGMSLSEMAEELNARDISTARGGAWSATQVKRVKDRLQALQRAA